MDRKVYYIWIACISMAVKDLVGMEEVAPENWERPRSELPVGVGVMPGEPFRPIKEGEEDVLISGRGVIP